MSLIKQYYRIYSKYDAAAIANSPLGRLMLLGWSLSGKVLWKLGRLERKPWFTRSSMHSVRHIMAEAKRRHEDPFILPPEVQSLRELRVGCITDDFTLLAFSPECEMCPVTSADWKQALEEFKPHLLLVESAWMGKEESWKWKVSVLSPELVELVVWCKRNGVPTVFWNKEDPKHYQTFIRAAEFFDVVFTTDADCISDYRGRLDTERVHLLPFAAQPTMHNPIETYDRKDSFCFAGSYYTQQMDRNITFSRFVTAISSIGELEIFDRYLNTQDVRMSFPDRYKQFIVGTLPPEEMDRAYKGYTYGINMNTIKGSQTMFARRVFELLASNTICVGNYSRGLRNFLGDLTVCTDDVEWFKRKILSLQLDRQDRDKYRLAGLRTVMLDHTYRHRLAHIVRCTFDRALDLGAPKVTVVATPRDQGELEAVLESYRSQRYEPKSLLLMVESTLEVPPVKNSMVIRPGEASQDLDLGHVAYFCAEDSYGPNYLVDLALGAWWSGAQAVGKSSYFSGRQAEERGAGQEYHFVPYLEWRAALVDVISSGLTLRDVLASIQVGIVDMPVCLSLDRFNYCRDHQGVCYSGEDLPIVDQGIPFDDMVHQLEGSEREGDMILGKSDMLYLCGSYPVANRAPAFNFLHVRPELARRHGAMIDVVRLNRQGERGYYALRDVDVAHLPARTIKDVLASGAYHHLQVHLLNDELWRAVLPHIGTHRTEVFVYGPEIVVPKVPDHYVHFRRERRTLEHHAREMTAMWQEVFASGVKLVFPSEHLAKDVMEQMGVTLEEGRYRISPVPVDPTIYKAPPSHPSRRNKVLCVRPYAGTMVDLQLLVATVEALAASPDFRQLTITLAGGWSRYEEVLAPLRRFENVRILDQDLSFEGKADLFAKHGVFLAPYGADPHGTVLAEAMACAMVPVVTDIGAVREVADDRSARIVAPNAADLARAVLELAASPQQFNEMAENARLRSLTVRGAQWYNDELDRAHYGPS